MSRLSESVNRAMIIVDGGDFSSDVVVSDLLAETATRRSLDLSDLTSREQADLIASRSLNLIPSADGLAAAIDKAAAQGRGFVVKYGIDPTSPDVHIGHAVPIIIAGRFQRMGHHVVFIIGDVTAKIGDPSGRSGDRPPLSDAGIAANLKTYQRQVSPFIDFTRADLRFNGEWLHEIRLPQLLEICASIPVSMSLQREDFRTRLSDGHGLSLAEFLYSVVMALDSVAVRADIELGGVDQLLNMQMCRRVMEISGQAPEMVLTTPLIEGTDGTGAKMSKSKGNYVPLTADPDEIYGRLMSIPDHLIQPYLQQLTEWTDGEISQAFKRRDEGTAHPMDLKRILAGDVVAGLHGLAAAAAARRQFGARFSRRSFTELENLVGVFLSDSGEEMLGTVIVRELGFTPSLNATRRIAQQDGLRLIVEGPDGQRIVSLGEDALRRPLRDVVADELTTGGLYLKVGRKVAQLHV